MESSIEDPDLLAQYKSAKGDYGAMKNVEQAASDRAMKNLSNRFVSPSDYAMGGMGGVASAASGHGSGSSIIAATALAAANKVARERGSAFAANSLKKLADVVTSAPEFLGKYQGVLERAATEGARSLAVTHHLLLNNDPIYRKIFEEDYKQ